MRIRVSSSMVVQIIDPHGVPVLEFKNHAPVLMLVNNSDGRVCFELARSGSV